jgi:hypothetical protein
VLVACAHDGVDFPVPEVAAREHVGGALRDMALAGESSAAVIAPVALAAVLARAAKVLMQAASAAPVVPDMAVDSSRG